MTKILIVFEINIKVHILISRHIIVGVTALTELLLLSKWYKLTYFAAGLYVYFVSSCC
jgi:hypothetical protein